MVDLTPSRAAAPSTTKTAREFVSEWPPKLRATIVAWHNALPPDASSEWRSGAAYVRESAAESLVRNAPDTQLAGILRLFTEHQVFVGVDDLYFDTESATDTSDRHAFQQMFERAMVGGIDAIGLSAGDRLFRNLADSIYYKQQLRDRGVALIYGGMWVGDPRHPAAWNSEVTQDANFEMHARNTSYYIGTSHEQLTRRGRPMGVPECYEPIGRGPDLGGRRGPVTGWRVVEPIGSILQEGARRYLAGASLADLAAWSVTTEMGGLSPSGAVMTSQWWRQKLWNPKLAGYQVPTNYQGYVHKSGRKARDKKRHRELAEEKVLVPCVLPALWSLDDHHAIRAVGRERRMTSKQRASYAPHLLLGIAYDVTCGHRMAVTATVADGRLRMGCKKVEIGPKHSKSMRVDIAEQELDALIGSIRFDDADLIRQVEEELHALSLAESRERARFKPNPAIASARQALAVLDEATMQDIRTQIEAQIAELEAADAERRQIVNLPVLNFRRAIALLRSWSEVWADADLRQKNELLRAARLRVMVGRLPGEQKRPPAHVLSISCDNPQLELALATVLSSKNMTFDAQHACWTPNVGIGVRMVEAMAPIATALFGSLSEGYVTIERRDPGRPVHSGDVRDRPADGQWLTTEEFAAATNRVRHGVRQMIEAGRLPARWFRDGSRGYWLIRAEEVAGAMKAGRRSA